MRAVRVLFCSAALLALFAPGVRADDYNKLTYFTFSAPVQVPGVTLPAGKYTFKLADPESGRRAIQIWNSEGTLLATLLTVTDARMDAKEPMVMFNEQPAGEPAAVRSWYYEGEHAGYEFIYPKDQAMKIARASHQPVLMTEENGSDLGVLKAAKVSRVDETGALADTSSTPAQSASTTAQSTSSGSTASATTTASSTSTDSASAAAPAAATAASSTSPATDSASAAAQPAAIASTSTPATDSASATTTAPEPSANRTEPTAAVARTDATVTSPEPVATSGSAQADSSRPAATVPATSSVSRQADPRPADTVARNRDAALPRTGSSLSLLALLSGLCLAIGLSVRRLRSRVA